jgi:hypothetical protein
MGGYRDLVQTLRFRPDYNGAPSLWYVGGPDDGAEWYEPELLSPELMTELDEWVEEWRAFHDCDVQDDTHVAWTERARALCERTRLELLPHGFLVSPDFEGRPKDSPFRQRQRSAWWRDIKRRR